MSMGMNQVRLARVQALPGVLEKDMIYFVQTGSGTCRVVVTDNAGSPTAYNAGLNARGAYSGAETYTFGDTVSYGGATWSLIAPSSTGHAPPTLPAVSNSYWTLLAEPGRSVSARGEYSGATEYSARDVVTRDGSSWIYINATSSSGHAPPFLPSTENAYWRLLAERGADGTSFMPDARGPFSGRSVYDDALGGFAYFSTDGDGDEITTAVLFIKMSDASGDWGPPTPFGTSDYNQLTNKPVLGTAAAEDVEAFATATQGAKADTAVQPEDTIADGKVAPASLDASQPAGFRAAINVRGRVNFFDFLQATRSAAVREQISNGTFTGDLAVEWTAFNSALMDISDAGGRPHGYIPECTIHTSVSPNFAMDYLTLETQGRPRIVAIGAINALVFNGAGLGTGGLGVQEMKIGTLTAETANGATGVLIQECHRSEFDPILCNGAVTIGVSVFGCVSSVFRKLACQPHISPFVATPMFGLVVSGNPGAQTSWCLFDMPIFEYQTVGILLDQSLGNTFLSGVAEGCTDTGLSVGQNALCNKFIGMDFEANTSHDIYCEGARNNFISVDSWSNSVFAGATCTKNKIVGGEWNIVGFSGGASSNVVNGINYNSTATGYLADAGYGNVFRDNVNRVTGLVHNGPSDAPAASGWIAPGPAAIDITSQPLEDTMRTWTNPFAQSVEVLIDANATSVIRKTAAGSRFDLGAGGKSLTLQPGGKVQIGYSTIPNVQFFIL